ncbi:Verru_Chthon cassette protein C [Phragmitibacter flavus]|uniref:Verru_Chthon cassette protein C n=1 Tax=Phragmitibacter flavus TaxID=2576071 RepID=A0A5R8KGV3_9BACT|nr:Verru_Chthon cassette protein C [Phragmitibacter flavus]TLD71536.1 Verru_Chthon cassette protein C [Phragmitibacter flavus]
MLVFKKRNRLIQGFTLVELLISAGLLAVIMVLVSQLTLQTSQVWRGAVNKIQTFQEARAAFESMTRTLSQATLNTYYDYYDGSNRSRLGLTATELAGFTPAVYDRISDLHFISGQSAALLANSSAAVHTQTHAVFFQAPLGRSGSYGELRNTLNACGYFLSFGSDESSVPKPVKGAPSYEPRYRFRLMEMTQRSERLGIYDPTTGRSSDWFVNHAATTSRVVAENVIALVLLPQLSPHDDAPDGIGDGVSIAPHYNYNSRVRRAAAEDVEWASASPAFPADRFTIFPAGGKPPLSASRHDQLPPLMKVVMVVIDEASARRVQGNDTTPPAAIDLAATSLFKHAVLLKDDLRAVEAICRAEAGNLTGNTVPLTYRIFTTEIIMREAKWSVN